MIVNHCGTTAAVKVAPASHTGHAPRRRRRRYNNIITTIIILKLLHNT